MCKLMRLAVSQIVDPQITGSRRPRVVVKQTQAVAGEGRTPARSTIHTFGQGQGARFSGCEVIQVNVAVAIHVAGVGQNLAVGREASTRTFPLFPREPADFLAWYVEQTDVVVAVAGIGGDQNVFAIGRNIIR